jgi:hypothetical protein
MGEQVKRAVALYDYVFVLGDIIAGYRKDKGRMYFMYKGEIILDDIYNESLIGHGISIRVDTDIKYCLEYMIDTVGFYYTAMINGKQVSWEEGYELDVIGEDGFLVSYNTAHCVTDYKTGNTYIVAIRKMPISVAGAPWDEVVLAIDYYVNGVLVKSAVFDKHPENERNFYNWEEIKEYEGSWYYVMEGGVKMGNSFIRILEKTEDGGYKIPEELEEFNDMGMEEFEEISMKFEEMERIK